jgi:hypothetical protein
MGKSVEELLNGLTAWEAVVTNDGYVNTEDRILITEAMASPDASILFPRVINRTLREAAEPTLLVTPLLQTVRLGQGRSLEFPAVNALQASEIPEGQEYPEQQLVFAKQIEGKVSKKGVKVAFTEEVIQDSLWDIVGLHVRAAGRAMARLKEQIALEEFRDAAVVVFDNDDSGEDDTTGRGIDGEYNLTMCWDDIVDMAAVLHSEKHAPTDFILHPLMWALFLKDAVYHAGGAAAGQSWNTSLKNSANVVQSSAPMGLNVIVTPFVQFTAKTDDSAAKSDVFLIDRNEIGVLLVKDDMTVDDWNDQTRDIRYLKMKERYDIVMLGDGEGIGVAKNVRLSRSYDVVVTNQVSL